MRQQSRRHRAEVSQGRPLGGRPSFLPPPPTQFVPVGSASSAWALPLPGRSLNRFPCQLRPFPTLVPPARPVPLSYKLLDGEAASPPLVFLHGLFGSKTNFNSIAKTLAQQTGRRVSFWSRRGPEGGGAWVGGALKEAEVWPASLSPTLGSGGSL